MMEPRENDERLADWVDGRMSERDRERLQAEIQVNPELAAKAESYRRTVELVRSALGEPEAPVDIADRVLAAVQAGSQQRSAPAARLRLFPMLASVGAAAALVLVYFSLRGLEPTPESRSVANLDAADAEVPHDGVVRGGEHREAEKLAVGEAPAAADAGEHMAKKGGRGGVRSRGLLDQRVAQLEEMADEIQATLDEPADLNYIAEQLQRGARRVQEDANRQLLRANEPQAPARKEEDKSAGKPETILQAKSRMRVAVAPGAEYEGKARGGGGDAGRGRRSDQRAARPGAKTAEPPAAPTTGGVAGKAPASGQEKSRTAKSGPATPGPAGPSTPQGHKGPGDTVPPSPTVAPVQSVEGAAGAEARQQGQTEQQTERQTGENSKSGQLKTGELGANELDRAVAQVEELESYRKQVAAAVVPGVPVVVVAAPPLVLGETVDDARDLVGTRDMGLDGFFAAQFPTGRFSAVREQPPQAPDAGGGGAQLYYKRLEPRSSTVTLNLAAPQLLILDSVQQQLWAGLPGLQPDPGNQVYCVEGERAQVGAMLEQLGAWIEENRTEVRFDQVPQPIVDPFFAQVDELRRVSNKERSAQKAEAPTEEQVLVDNEAENAVSQRMKVLVVYEQQPKPPAPATPPAEQPKPAEAQRVEKKR